MNQILTNEEIIAAFEGSDGTWVSTGRAVIAAYEAKLHTEQLERTKLIRSSVPAKLNSVEPYEIDYPNYHYQGMGCGLEDHGITDRYQAMKYGWDCAIEAMQECIPENLYEHPPAPSVANISLTGEGKTNQLADFIHRFKRHVGGDGEFWLHELEDFYFGEVSAARSE